MPSDSEKPDQDRFNKSPRLPDEPDGDGFPAEEDVSTPPPESDQADGEDDD